MVIFGFDKGGVTPTPADPRTVLVNPAILALGEDEEKAGKAASRSPACAAWCRAGAASATPASTRPETP